MYTTVAVQWNKCVVWQVYLLGTYANNLKCMYTSASGYVAFVGHIG